MTALDITAEREKIQREIDALERSLGPDVASIDVVVSDSSVDPEDDSDIEDLDGDSQKGDVIWEDGTSKTELCLQMNLVYQAVIEEKIQELELLLANNKEQQEELLWEIAGRKNSRSGESKQQPSNVTLGHFLRPYFRDKVTGVGPPANQDMIEKSAQGIKSFEELTNREWKSRDKKELKIAVISDRLQKMLQPKLFKLEYLQTKRDNSKSEIDKKILTKQIQETEREIDDINQLPEDVLIGKRTDEHDWDKICNINFEGAHSAEKLRRIWQNLEHPHISKGSWEDEEVSKLLEIAAKHNYVNWQAIAEELGTNRTAFQCLQVYQLNNKDFKRKEFTKEEDEMLTHLVQQMRVGNHIPYRKISYFMEGRDGVQLLCRWSKSIDPNLKKGSWTKSEDELLLKAVAKYGAKDWYKIREEVPGRSDVQCRERYVKGLHRDLKKGKWSVEEKEKLMELIEKHGVGNWAKVASELTHRSGSQCLSKWKGIMGLLKRSKWSKKRIKKEKVSESEGTTSTSSSSSEESDLELTDSSEEDKKKKKSPKRPEPVLQKVPRLDLWVPRKLPLTTEAPQNSTSPLIRVRPLRTKRAAKIQKGPFQFTTVLKGIAYPHSTDTVIEDPKELINEAAQNRRQILCISEDDVRRILKVNTQLRHDKQVSRLGIKPSSSDVPGADQPEGQVPGKPESVLRKKVELCRDTLERRLLLAVTPWVGNVFLPLSACAGRPLKKKMIQADVLKERISSIPLSSTPVFTFFIQFFRIDADGCLKIIKDRKPKPAAIFTKKNPTPTIPKVAAQCVSVPAYTSYLFGPFSIIYEGVQRTLFTNLKVPTKPIEKPIVKPIEKPIVSTKSIEKPIETTSVAVRPSIDSQQNCPLPSSPPCHRSRKKEPPKKREGPAPKLKTVYELLREKRVREKRQKEAANRTALQSVIIQPAINAASQRQTVVLPLTPSQSERTVWPVMPLVSLPACQIIQANSSSSSPGPGADAGKSNLGNPSTEEKGKSTNSPSASNSPAPAQGGSSSTAKPPQQSITLMPTLVGGTGANSSVLPVTWFVTPQGLVPIPLQALRFSTPASTQPSNEAPSPAPSSTSGAEDLTETRPPPDSNATESNNVTTPHVVKTEPSSGSGSEVASGPGHGASPGSDKVTSDHAPSVPAPLSPKITTVASPNAADIPSVPLVRPPLSTPSPSPASNNPCSHPPVPKGQASLGLKRYPVVKIAKILPLNHSENAAPNSKSPPKIVLSPGSKSNSQPTPCSPDRNHLNLSLVSLEEESKVKEWLPGCKDLETPTPNSNTAYLPPSVCTLKMLSRLLLQKNVLEDNAFKLVPPLEGGILRSPGTKTEVVKDIVNQKLKDNPAYLLLKQRFLSAFALSALLAVLPPGQSRTTMGYSKMKYDSSDEDADHSTESESNQEAEEEGDDVQKSCPDTNEDDVEDQEASDDEESGHETSTNTVDGMECLSRRTTRKRTYPLKET
ncbi:snRNA-activating protein complex subunit 4 [Spea bombifrons]|uniref:snRNA-activating protein complex subunit 4 n=1 Tax=Spea bombifrons TaxID=233779 RepID=UPI00234B107F|nr:snRNA-activating protein complex subunit 4 [Spea bombifrons]